MEWCTIESDPGVFTELIQKIGVKDVQVEELWSLGDEDFEKVKPVYGLIFLFKWQKETDDRPVDYSVLGDLFFARQVITNACATQALLSILLNQEEKLDVGPVLGNFKQFASALDPETAGEAINSMDEVRVAHNSFNRPEPFLHEDKQSSGKSDDVFHFIAYVPYKGKVYELDGLKEGPICLGEYSGEEWLAAVRPHIEGRIERYAGSEIRFNLLAVIKDQRVVVQERIEARVKRIEALESVLGSGADQVMADANFFPISIEDVEGFERMLDSKELGAIKAQLDFEMSEKERDVLSLEQTEQKFASWKEENIRRKHNYIPLCVAMLDVLARKGKLDGLLENAKKKQDERIAAAQKAKAAESKSG